MKKKMITDLELFGRKIKTKDDLKDVFDVEGFIERRAKITSWLNEKHPKKNKKLSSIESDEEWIKELAAILDCQEKYQEYITAQKEPDKKESASSVSTDESKDITPLPTSPKTTPVKVSSASELREVLKQGCDEICVTGYLADCVCDLIKNMDSSRIEFIRKCEAYLNSPETEEESLKEVMFSLGLNGSSKNDKDYFGILDYNKIDNMERAQRILIRESGASVACYSDCEYDLSRCALHLLDFDISSRANRRGKIVIVLSKRADNTIQRYANIFKKCCLTCNRLVIQRGIEVNDLGTCIAYTGTGMCDAPTGYCGETSGQSCCYYYKIWSKLDSKIDEVK